MLIQKFGGTSVGSALRIKDLVKLVANPTPKIVVLSAMSGTTNALVEINNALYNKNTVLANELISKLKSTYDKVITVLYSKPESIAKANDLVRNHFEYIKNFRAKIS